MPKKYIALCVVLPTLIFSFLFWLALDESELRLSTDIEDYVPMPEGGEVGYEMLLELSRNDFSYVVEDLEGREPVYDSEEYRDYLLRNMEGIVSNYQAVKKYFPVLEAIASQEVIADTNTQIQDPFVRFLSTRIIVRAICLHTNLSIYDDTVDTDLYGIYLLYSIISKWHPHNRVLLHSMMNMNFLNRIHKCLDLILASLSASEKERILSILLVETDYVDIICGSIYYEYCSTANALDSILEEGGSLLAPFLLHRNRTLNIFGNWVVRIVDAAERGDLNAVEEINYERPWDAEGVGFRNSRGKRLLAMSIPGVSKLFEMATKHQEMKKVLIEKYRVSLEK